MSNTPSRLVLTVVCSLGMCLQNAAAQTIERARLSDNDLSCTQIYAEVQQMDTVMQLAGPGLPTAPVQTVNIPIPAQPIPTPAQASVYSNQAAINQAQMQQLMANSNRADLRAASRDPAQVAQVTAMMQNPQMAVAAQRAVAAGVNPALIQSQLAAAGAAQQAAANSAGFLGGAAAPAPAPLAGLASMLGSGLGGQGGGNAAGLAGMFGALAGMAAPKADTSAAPAAPVAIAQALPQKSSNASMGAQARARKEHLTSLFLSRGCKLADVVR